MILTNLLPIKKTTFLTSVSFFFFLYLRPKGVYFFYALGNLFETENTHSFLSSLLSSLINLLFNLTLCQGMKCFLCYLFFLPLLVNEQNRSFDSFSFMFAWLAVQHKFFCFNSFCFLPLCIGSYKYCCPKPLVKLVAWLNLTLK